MGFGRRVSLAFRAFWNLLRSGTLPDDIVAAAAVEPPAADAGAAVVLARAPVERPDDGAVLLLSVLQREGRLVDFLMEDLGTYCRRPDWRRGAGRARELPAGAGERVRARADPGRRRGAGDHGAGRLRPRLDQAGRPRRGIRAVPRHLASSRVAVSRVQLPALGAPGRTADRRSRRSGSLLKQKGRRVAPRFIVGIDLGTTNCALAAVSADAGEEQRADRVRDIPQLVNPNEVAARSLLPSFLFLPGEVDFPAGSLELPWTTEPPAVVGELARKRGAENPVRLVASAKSWLSHAAANRSGAILPWGAPAEVPQGVAGGRVGAYLRTCATPGTTRRAGASRTQDVLLTVPASFDAVARELTVRAARRGGPRARHAARGAAGRVLRVARGAGRRWRKQVRVGDLVLVCDVGGGTTDFTLIAVVGGETASCRSSASPSASTSCSAATTWTSRSRACCRRGSRSRGTRSTPGSCTRCGTRPALRRKRSSATRRSRAHPVTLLGRGSKLIGGTIRTELTADDVRSVLVDGFFPRVASDASPRASGGSASRSSVCRTRPTRRSRGTSRGSSAAVAAAADVGRPARPERAGVPDARALQRRRDEGRRAARAASSRC